MGEKTRFPTSLAQNTEKKNYLFLSPCPTEESWFLIYPCGTEAFQAESFPWKQGLFWEGLALFDSTRKSQALGPLHRKVIDHWWMNKCHSFLSISSSASPTSGHQTLRALKKIHQNDYLYLFVSRKIKGEAKPLESPQIRGAVWIIYGPSIHY